MQVCDVHCHFFSSRFLEILTKDRRDIPPGDHAAVVSTLLGWEPPGPPDALADRWVAELDEHQVARAALIASIPGDEESVAAAIARHPSRLVGFFMLNPSTADAAERLSRALERLAAARASVCSRRCTTTSSTTSGSAPTFEAAAARGAAVFVHCGVLTVGVRKKLGLASPFNLRLGDPLALATVAARFPKVPVIIPHFGAGFLREALMAADQCPNIHLDTSSTNGWVKYHPGLTLEDVFRQALAVVGPDRLIFGSDSSFFPRGWQRQIFELQKQTLDRARRAPRRRRRRIFSGNFERLFG